MNNRWWSGWWFVVPRLQVAISHVVLQCISHVVYTVVTCKLPGLSCPCLLLHIRRCLRRLFFFLHSSIMMANIINIAAIILIILIAHIHYIIMTVDSNQTWYIGYIFSLFLLHYIFHISYSNSFSAHQASDTWSLHVAWSRCGLYLVFYVLLK